MEYQIGALVVPGEKAGTIVQAERFDFKVMQKAVGGLIERAFLTQELEDRMIDAYINEEGKLLNLKPSAVIYDKDIGDCEEGLIDVIAGPILFVGHDGYGGTLGLNEEQKDWIMNNLVEFVEAVNDDNPEEVLKLMIFRR